MVTQLPLRPSVAHLSPAQALLAELRADGVQLRIENGFVKWSAPPGAMNVARMRQIKALEGKLVTVLLAEGRQDMVEEQWLVSARSF